MQYVIVTGSQYLKELGRWHAVWVTERNQARHYTTKAEAQLVAFAIEADILPVTNEA